MRTSMLRTLASSLLILALLSCADSRTTSEVPAPEAFSPRAGEPAAPTARDSGGTSPVPGAAEGGNAPPVLTVKGFALNSTGEGDTLGVNVDVTDPDGDEVTLAYEWYKNGELAGTEETLSDFRRGDKITVTIVPSDGLRAGRGKTLGTEIVNSSPRISGLGEQKTVEGTMLLQVDASDPDGDALVYSLEPGSKGMTIDGATGQVTWVIPSDFQGESRSAVIVDDGHGGTARFEFIATAP